MKGLLKYIYRSLRGNWRTLLIKVFTLAIGIALSVVLLTKVFYEYSVDKFYPDISQLYKIEVKYGFKGNGNGISTLNYSYISGGVANKIAEEVGGVEVGTRFYELSANYVITPAKREFIAHAIIADEFLFDVLSRPILQGDANEVLQKEGSVMISKSLADKLGDEGKIGSNLILDINQNKLLIIGGIYEDFPYNSSLSPDVVVPLKSILSFSTYDGSNDWIGNDRYFGVLKLHPKVDYSLLTTPIKEVQCKYQNQDYLEKAGVTIEYILKPLASTHTDKNLVKQGMILLSSVALLLLLVALLNYALLSTSTIIGKAKEIALHKCMGAGKRDILFMVYAEALIHILLATSLAVLLLIMGENLIFELTRLSIEAYLNSGVYMALGGVILFLFIATGVVPAYLYFRIPALSILKAYGKSKRSSKLVFLFLQIMVASLLLTFLVYVNRQYREMLYEDVGYSYENIAYTSILLNNNESVYRNIISALKDCALVDDVATATYLPFESCSGNNFKLIDQDEDLLNIADMYGVSSNYLSVMGMRLIEGADFTEDTPLNEILVSENLKDKLAPFIDVTDGLTGKELHLSEHGIVKIRGVYKEIRLGSVINYDPRPSVVFHSQKPTRKLIIKLKEMGGDGVAQINKIVSGHTETERFAVTPYVLKIKEMYREAYQLQLIISLGSIIAFLIVFIGLIGYTQYEVKSRSKEIAIRKINGASFKNLFKLFSKHILYISIPAIAMGMCCSIYLSTTWSQDFAIKASLTCFDYLGIALFIIALLGIVTWIQLSCITNANPVKSLKSE